jgi:hypothetical protein
MESAARNVDGVISGGPKIRIGSARYPAAPDCLISEFGDHGILLRLRYWANEPYRIQTVQSKVQTEVWSAFEGTDIEIAYPHTQHVFDDAGGQLQVAFGNEGARRPPANPDQMPPDSSGAGRPTDGAGSDTASQQETDPAEDEN